MAKLPTLREMLDAGAHFGHRTSRWHPKMESYIFMAKSGVHVINLEKTAEELEKAVSFIKDLAASNKTVMFVGSKKQTSDIIKKAAADCGMPYINFRWIGGTLTNFSAIKAAIIKHKKQKELLEDNRATATMSKKELSKLRKNVEKYEKILGGMVNLEKKPDALFVVSAHDEVIALKEAAAENVPVIAIVDTNTDPTAITYPIPANDDATKSVDLFCDVVSQTIKENKGLAVKQDNEAK